MHKSKSTTTMPLQSLAKSIKRSIDADLKLQSIKNKTYHHKNSQSSMLLLNNKQKYRISPKLNIDNNQNQTQKYVDMNRNDKIVSSVVLGRTSSYPNIVFDIETVVGTKFNSDVNPISKSQIYKYGHPETMENVQNNCLINYRKAKSITCSKDQKQNDINQFEELQKNTQNLYEEIDKLQTHITKINAQINQSSNTQGNNVTNKTKMKVHHHLLQQYSKLLQDIQRQEQIKQLNIQQIQQIKNRIQMFKEDQQSKFMCMQSVLAEHQYLEEVLANYNSQYPSQSQIYIPILQQQKCIEKLTIVIYEKQNKLAILNQELVSFKQQTKFELDHKIIKKKVTEFRMNIMEILQQLDEWAKSNKLGNVQSNSSRIWEILCGFLYSKSQNPLQLEKQWGWKGVEGWICSNGLLSQWQQYIYSYKLSNQITKTIRYPPQLLQKYFSVLKKMELTLTSNTKLKENMKEHEIFRKNIQDLNLEIIKYKSEIEDRNQNIKQLQQKIEQDFGTEAMANIQFLQQQKLMAFQVNNTILKNVDQNKKNNDPNKKNKTSSFPTQSLLDLQTIKATLKSLKYEQNSRLDNIHKIHTRLQNINNLNISQYYNNNADIQYLNQLQQLNQKCHKSKLKNKCILKRLQQMEQHKIKIQNKINEVIDQWKILDKNKAKLKLLYRQLNQNNKKINHVKIGEYHSRIKSDSNSKLGRTLKSSSTLKLNNSGTFNGKLRNYANKQNLMLSINSRQTISNKNPKYLNIIDKGLGKTKNCGITNNTANLRVKTSKKLPSSVLEQLQQQIGQVITRKPSLLKQKSVSTFANSNPCMNNMNNKNNDGNRQSLTAMLLSKLTK